MTPDDERLEQIKNWWKEFRWTVIGGLGVGVIAVGGWTGWVGHTQSQQEAASELFQQLSVAVVDADVEVAQQAHDDLLAEYSRTAYADQARLLMARAHYEAGAVDNARTLLETAISQSSDPSTVHAARIRLAQLLIAETQFQAALDVLGSSATGQFESYYQELKGDAYRALNRYAEATEAYQASIDSLSDGSTSYRTILTLKLNDTLVAE